MAWNKYYIVVTQQAGVSPAEVLSELGFPDFRPAGEVSFHATNKLYDLFVGTYEDKLIIAHPDLVYSLLRAEPSKFERKMIEVFPTSEIAALAENSTVNEFGYAVIDQGQRIRVKHGCDGEIYTDIGTPLAEEKAILSEGIFSPVELEQMRQEMDEEEVLETVAFEASWRVPGELSRRYFGDVIDNLDADAIRMVQFTKV